MTHPVVRDSEQGQGASGLELVPGWEHFPWLRAGFSTRLGGHSHAYGDGEQNLGWTPEDDPRTIAQARRVFANRVAQGSALPLVTVRQVHGAVIRDLEVEPQPWMTDDGKARMEGDGLINLTPGRLLAILTADCVPVLLADTRTHAVGAFHAGWRGTQAHIVEQGISAMQDQYGTRREDLVAAIGPCIEVCCFQVGEEVRDAFTRAGDDVSELFSVREGGLFMDLVAANRRQLLASGLAPDRIRSLSECTACSRTPEGRRKYFSYRAEAGKTGRMLSAIAAIA